MLKKIVMILGIVVLAITTPWFQRILSKDIFIAIIILVQTIGLFLYINGLGSKTIGLCSFIAILMLSIFLLSTQFDKGLINHSKLDLVYLKQRSNYYPHERGVIIHNKYTLSLFKLQRNFFSNIDFNQFFFGGRPRFRPFALDFPKLPIFYLPFFLYGIFSLLTFKPKLFVSFIAFSLFILLITAFINPSFELGPYVMLPIITSLVFTGFYQFLTFLLKLLKKQKHD